MTAKELREKDDAALHEQLKQTQRHLYDLRVQSVTEKVDDTSQLGKAKQDIARIKTILHERKRQSEAK